MAQGRSRDEAAVEVFREMNIRRSCCKNTLFNHIELMDRKIAYDHFANEDKRARPMAVINPDIKREGNEIEEES